MWYCQWYTSRPLQTIISCTLLMYTALLGRVLNTKHTDITFVKLNVKLCSNHLLYLPFIYVLRWWWWRFQQLVMLSVHWNEAVNILCRLKWESCSRILQSYSHYYENTVIAFCSRAPYIQLMPQTGCSSWFYSLWVIRWKWFRAHGCLSSVVCTGWFSLTLFRT